MKNIILFIFSSFLIFTSCSDVSEIKDPPIDTTESKQLTNVSYGDHSKQVYDIYLPKNRTLDTKIMVLVHGGGWNEGDKADTNDFKNFISEQLPSIAVVNMNYRLADENNPPYPMQIDDISAVVNHLETKQNEYQIGTELGFLGVSAGGHLSLLWSYAFDSNNQVNMVTSIVGPTNLSDDAYINSSNEDLQNLIFQFGTDVEVLKEVSPLFNVEANSPPTQLFYGKKDPLIPNSQGIDLNLKLDSLNVKHEFTHYENGGHGWLGLDLLDTSIKLKTFIEANL
ncbi:alpha/beta hydrolase [Aurantibacter crassamenti]|uniref:alpha/beta hydrolase n=1 Tax=Aurantibacter crassamenti TaxID=1837375 RepID=UPI00193A4F60|nr:alpha/beta hydrolase [Aurantibacter crassamenti]MBM1107255.1 alpha/beta hydrolase [Aurantibacter crassamenti]